MSSGNFLKKQSDRFKACIEAVDMAFVSLRIILFCGGIGWLVFSDISRDTFANANRVFLFFAVYSVFIYVWLFLSPHRKKYIYGIALMFDLIYASMLVSVTGGFHSSFLNGFYLITALYSFYYGLLPGTIIAAVASGLYFVSSGYQISVLHWTDFFVRISFMFLLAVPLGMLSQKLKKDKSHIEVLNKDLEKYIEELRSVQGKLIQVEKLSALGRLTADVAHEIRNPLTSIGGFARRLNNRLSKDSREKDYAEIVVAEVDRLERILRDVLTFSQETKSEMEYQEVNGIVREALKTYEGMCADQTVSIDMDLHSPLPLVLIDKDQVRLAINNLITNAIDVMPRGGVLTVKTHTEELSHVEYIAVEVMDTGPGLPNEALNMIFEPFFTTKEIGAGTGLGLSICKKITDENNGLIFVVSELGKGTTFKIMFPYQKEEDRVKIKCWEYTKCGVENAEGAANMRCPAYPDYGRICWTIAGTFCGKRVSGAIAQKLGDCKKCDFYQRVAVSKDL
jgi:signal transduction histidine kinase